MTSLFTDYLFYCNFIHRYLQAMINSSLTSCLWLRAKKWKEISEVFSESFSHFLYIFSFLTVFSVCGSWHKAQSTAMLAAFPGGTANSSLSCHFTLGVSYSVDYLVRSLSLFQHHCFQGTFSITYLWLYFLIHLMLWFCFFLFLLQVCFVYPEVSDPLLTSLMSRGNVIC